MKPPLHLSFFRTMTPSSVANVELQPSRPACQVRIRGLSRGGFATHYELPAYCPDCGTPYPWTEERLQAARELIELAEIPADEKAALQGDLAAIAADTPRTAVAATKFKRFMGKIGPEMTGAMREILVKLATEGAKNLMFPGA